MISKIAFLFLLFTSMTCFPSILEYVGIYGIFVKVGSMEEQEKIEETLRGLEDKYELQIVTNRPVIWHKDLGKLSGVWLFSLVPSRERSAEFSDSLIERLTWAVDPTLGSTFKSESSVFMYIPIVFQNLVFPCISIPIFSPLCIAPISWIGGCFDRTKTRALILANSQILKHDRYTGEVLYGEAAIMEGEKTLPTLLENIEEGIHKILENKHRYKKPLIILFFSGAHASSTDT